MSTFLQIHNNNVGADLFDVFVADIAVVIGAYAREPFTAVGNNNFFNATGTMVELKVYDVTDTVAGF